jgi:putative transposase
VTRVSQVWSTDITCIPMAHGFVSVAAVMDWYGRFVLSWALSLTIWTGADDSWAMSLSSGYGAH